MKNNAVLRFVCLVILGAAVVYMALNWKEVMQSAKGGFQAGEAGVAKPPKT